ncbi:MAG: hypothetical protein JSR56_11785 [Proteobacteria bacterium]|nr:hypothetical protein [Pseudomonadota bacterium]
MAGSRNFFAELGRRNVWRAAVLYIGAVWALSQGIAQLGPFFGAPDWIVRWFVIACCVGFPVWLAFAWYYAWTPEGFKRESEVAPEASIARSTGRKLDFWIIGVLAIAVVLLVTNQFVLHRDATSQANAANAKALAARVAQLPRKSLAVLPFANDSGDQTQRYFSDGLSEDLITALSQLSGLKVISRDASFRFRDSKDSTVEIAARLGVANLLEGSVQREGDEVRISVELVNAADGSTAWSHHYDRPFKDLFKLQDNVAHDVATALQARLVTAPGAVAQNDRPPSGNLDAYTAFLLGRSYRQQGKESDLHNAVAAQQNAIKVDPNYAAAYAELSRDWSILGEEFLDGAEMKEAYARSLQAANTAIALNPDLATAHFARAQVLLRSQLDWKDARTETDRARRLDPSAYGTPAAQDSDPQTPGYWFQRGSAFAAKGQLADAENALRTGVAMRPDWWIGYMELELVQVRRGEAKAAMATARHIPPGAWGDFAVALAAQIGDSRAAADASLKKLIGYKNGLAAYQVAEVYAVRKDPDSMFQWLDHAWTIKDPGLQQLPHDPFMDTYRTDPRFEAFCRRIGLTGPGCTRPGAVPSGASSSE